MSSLQRRILPRTTHKSPIQYAYLDSNEYNDSMIYNVSKTGIYFENFDPVQPQSKIRIKMVNYSPTAKGVEAARFYLGKTRWCRELSLSETTLFGIGVQLLAKSNHKDYSDLLRISQTCDLCGRTIPSETITELDKCIELCQNCCKSMGKIPEGKGKDMVKRFLMGNVV